MNPIDAPVSIIVRFLTRYFAQGVAYVSIYSARAAISLISKNDTSQDKTLERFVKGVSWLRPPKPRYNEIWDISPVIEYLENIKPLEKLSLEILTKKLTMLLMLATGHRLKTLSLLKISKTTKGEKGFVLKVADIIKTSKPGAAQPFFKFPYFEQNKEFYVFPGIWIDTWK